jgi:hypothetical protein
MMHQPEKILFTWSSMFGNNYFLGRIRLRIRLQRHPDSRRVRPRGVSPAKAGGWRRGGTANRQGARQDFTRQHMENFFDCVRSRKAPDTPFEVGFRTAIACQMAVASYRQQRTVRWDAATGEIV